MLSHKYQPRRRNAHSPLKNYLCSPCWAALRKGKATFNKGTKWITGSNSGLSFWDDKWLNRSPLQSLIPGPLNKGEENIKLVDVGNYFGWNLEHISFSFPKQIILEMKATPFPLINCGVDRICWQSSPSGDFKFKDAYHLVLEEEHGRSSPLFNGGWVWKVRSTPKVQCFLWKCCHLSIPVRATLRDRGMQLDPGCPMCKAESKSIEHALRDCPTVQSFWNSVSPPTHPSLFYGANIIDWLRLNCHSTRKCGVSKIEWGIIFPLTVWSIWLHRNNMAFERIGNHRDMQSQTLMKAAKVAYLDINGKHMLGRVRIQVKWTPPPLHWFKLNSDGSSLGNPGLAGGGGIIRDNVGN